MARSAKQKAAFQRMQAGLARWRRQAGGGKPRGVTMPSKKQGDKSGRSSVRHTAIARVPGTSGVLGARGVDLKAALPGTGIVLAGMLLPGFIMSRLSFFPAAWVDPNTTQGRIGRTGVVVGLGWLLGKFWDWRIGGLFALAGVAYQWAPYVQQKTGLGFLGAPVEFGRPALQAVTAADGSTVFVQQAAASF